MGERESKTVIVYHVADRTAATLFLSFKDMLNPVLLYTAMGGLHKVIWDTNFLQSSISILSTRSTRMSLLGWKKSCAQIK